MTTFVSVGNALQPFSRLLNEVVRIRDQLPEPVIIQYGNTPFDDKSYRSKAFFHTNEYLELIKLSKILIIHGGAGSILHALEFGKFPVVVPRLKKYGEHINDHQLEFGRQLKIHGRIELIESIDKLEESILIKPAIRDRLVSQNESELVNDIRRLLEEEATKFSKKI